MSVSGNFKPYLLYEKVFPYHTNINELDHIPSSFNAYLEDDDNNADSLDNVIKYNVDKLEEVSKILLNKKEKKDAVR